MSIKIFTLLPQEFHISLVQEEMRIFKPYTWIIAVVQQFYRPLRWKGKILIATAPVDVLQKVIIIVVT
jgi:hypothetical protein